MPHKEPELANKNCLPLNSVTFIFLNFLPYLFNMIKTLIISSFLLAGSILTASAQNAPSWMRYSSISPDGKTIVFTYKGDLYKVPSAGGTALPLTMHEAHDFMPIWSKDGRYIAFASDRYGNFDVFVMPSQGGEVKRLTFHSANEFPYDFAADNSNILFGSTRMDAASNRQFPTGSQPELYKVPVNGGRVQQVLTTPAEDIKVSSNGSIILYHDKKGGENSWRKHQVSAIARDIWMYDVKSGKHTKLTTAVAEDRNPVFTDNEKSVYYLSEASGNFNVHKFSLDNPSAVSPVTSFKKHPVRFLSIANDGTLCFGYDGDIYTKRGNAEPQKVTIAISSDIKTNNERVVPVSTGVRDMAVAPGGKEVAYIFRGEVFVSAIEGGVTKRITNTPEQERNVSFAPDGKSLIYSSERGKSWKIYQTEIVRKEEPYFFASTVLKETPLIENDKENYQPLISPDGKEVAYIEDRMTLKVYNLASKKSRTLLSTNELFSTGDNDQYFAWSPDSKWITFQYSEAGFANEEVGLISADGKGKVINLTESGYNDRSPIWTMNGKMLLWFSDREGLKSYANSGSRQQDVYAMFLTQEAYDRYRLSKEEFALLKELEEKALKADSTKKKDTKKDTVAIDWDGLKYRKAKLTIHSSNLADALLSKDGETLFYLTRFEKGLNLWSTNLRTKETKMLIPLNANSGSLVWDKEQKNIFLQADGRIIRIDPATSKQDNVSINGEMNLNTSAERQFMFDHVWRRTKKTFYTAGYHGAKWDELRVDYEKYVPHISNNYEFSEMLSELLGELNVSHSGASYVKGDANADATASLGIFYDVDYTGKGIRIDEVIKEGPLDKAGMNIKPGTTIEQIDGEPVTAERDIAQFLNRKAGKNTLLTLVEPNNTRREVLVKPISLGEESTLLYKRWVRRNADEVDRLSNGQLGYVHIPGMNDVAYRNVYEDVMGKYGNRKAMVIDTRNNSGGDLVSDLATFLTGKTYMVNANDNRIVSNEPTFRWNKPSIALANEANYSDGHCFAFGYTELKIGKLVGMPVPGTCTWAGWEALQDNSIRWGVPPLGVKTASGTYLENAQTNPDIKVMNEYELVSKGRDQQLETAVKELLKELK
jgi:Tol biopolymer transport system component/C-terminal processing protease CtpA/Prc